MNKIVLLILSRIMPWSCAATLTQRVSTITNGWPSLRTLTRKVGGGYQEAELTTANHSVRHVNANALKRQTWRST